MAFERLNGTLRRLFGRLRIDAGRSGTSTDAALTVNQDSGNVGRLLDLRVGGASRFRVSPDSNTLGILNINSSRLGSHPSSSYLCIESPFGIKITDSLFSNNEKLFIANGYTNMSRDFYLGWVGDQTNSVSGNPTNSSMIGEDNGVLALRYGINPHSLRVYSTYWSSTSYHRMALTCAKQTLSNVSGATVATTGGLIPAGAFLMGVTTRINTPLGAGNGTTGYTVGDGSDADLWGSVTAIAAGTASKAAPITSESSGYTANDACGLYLAAQDVTLTATGGNFDGTGAIEVSAFYFLAEAD